MQNNDIRRYEVGEMQIHILNKWKSFHIEDVFENIKHVNKLPKARCWNGQEWKRIGIRNHVLGIIGLINEDMEELDQSNE